MAKEEQDAKVLYEKIMLEDKNKTFMDILPPDFKHTKRSIIKRTILAYIDKAYEALNSCDLYEGRVFDRKEIVRYMMRGIAYSNFHLAYLFIKRAVKP